MENISLIKSKHNIILIDGGLNNFYTNFASKIVNYENLLDEIIRDNYYENQETNELNKKFPIDCEKFFENFAKIENFEFSFSLNFQSVEIIYKNFINFLNENLPFIDNKPDKLIIKEKKFEFLENDFFTNTICKFNEKNFILIHKNIINLLTDYIILKNFSFNENFIYVTERNDYYDSLKVYPKNYIVYGRNLQELYNYKKFGCWTVYLTDYIFTTFHKEVIKEKDINSSSFNIFINNKSTFDQIEELNKKNKEFILNNGRLFDFACIFHSSNYNYLQYISEINKSCTQVSANSERLKKKLSEINPIRVLILSKSLFKIREFNRASSYYISDNEIYYIPYLGFDSENEFDLNGEFDVLFYKLNHKPELLYYKKLVNTTNLYLEKNPHIYMANNLDNIDYFEDRGRMLEILRKTISESQDIIFEHKTSIIVPDSKIVGLTEINSVEKFTQFLKENNLNTPLILKLSGPGEKFNHLMSSIVSDDGVVNYINHILDYSQGVEDNVSILIQSFFNHGGKVIKSYYVNKTSYDFLRPSLPDMLEEYTQSIEEFKLGYFNFFTSDLVSKKFEILWEKFHIEKDLDSKVDHQFLNKICSVFEKVSKKTLFGLDFLFNLKKNEYSLVDCNYFPGYKEFKGGLGFFLKNHLLNYYKSFKKEQ